MSFKKAVAYINENYGVPVACSPIRCTFSDKNEQCIKMRCPFYPGE